MAAPHNVGLNGLGPREEITNMIGTSVTVYNDYASPIIVTFSDVVGIDAPFGGSVALLPLQNRDTTIQPSISPPQQPHFNVNYSSGEAMSVDVGFGVFTTSLSPTFLASGQGGAIIAPGEPSYNSYNFIFCNGPGIVPPLVNGLIQVWLPILLQRVSQNPIQLYKSSNTTIELTALTVPSGSLQCTYASIGRPTSGNEELVIFSSLFNISTAALNLSISIGGQVYLLSVTVQDLNLYLRGDVDLSLQTEPSISALQFSLGGFNISGTFLNFLQHISPVLYSIIESANATNLAGFMNTTLNSEILKAINSAIADLLNSTVQFMIKPFQENLTSRKITATSSSTPALVLDNGRSTWMTNPNIQNMTLGSLKFPGTHDSPTYSLTDKLSPVIENPTLAKYLRQLSPGPSVPTSSDNPIYVGQPLYDFIMGQGINSAARAQDTLISTQLASGIRYFDLRLLYDEDANDFNYQHTIAGTGFTGILQQFSSFLNTADTTELVFALISDTNFAAYPDQMTNFTNLIQQQIGADHIYYPATANTELFEMNTLYNTKLSSITNNSSKIMFMFADSGYAFTDTVVNSSGFPRNSWSDYMGSVADLEARESNIKTSPDGTLWQVQWSLDANTQLIPLYFVDRFNGVENWVLRDGAQSANPALPAFLAKHGGSNGVFNLVTCDWFEIGIDVAEWVIDLNSPA